MRRSAFTMIELIFVIVILGILAAVALPKFAGIQDDALVSSEKSGIGSVRSSLQAVRGRAIVNQGREVNLTIQDDGGLYYQAVFYPDLRVNPTNGDQNLSHTSYPNSLSTGAWSTGSTVIRSATVITPRRNGEKAATGSGKGDTHLNIVLEPGSRTGYVTSTFAPATAIVGGAATQITGPATTGVLDNTLELCLGKSWVYNSLSGTIAIQGVCNN